MILSGSAQDSEHPEEKCAQVGKPPQRSGSPFVGESRPFLWRAKIRVVSMPKATRTATTFEDPMPGSSVIEIREMFKMKDFG
jgi:hypothetical protein